ncbi:hypothetical protein [Pseudomonas viridiflava]|uniref:hypothetical protein n=1 Tax=Pseudomonas viridiflava TaxID=33069 RepID=UPI000EFC4133|nr:hypothetical protein [Pseudomonas viridiflava]
MVAVALGLPPQSFDVTVGFLALLFYIPAWILIIALILSLLGFVFLVVAAMASFLIIPLGYAAALMNMVGLLPYLRRLWSRVVLGELDFTEVLGHSVGATFAGYILIKTYVMLITNFQPWVYSSVRLVAVLSDFQPAELYPGVGSKERVHPLENGFIAVAKVVDDKSISIRVKKQVEDLESTGGQSFITSIPSLKTLIDHVSGSFENPIKKINRVTDLSTDKQ